MAPSHFPHMLIMGYRRGEVCFCDTIAKIAKLRIVQAFVVLTIIVSHSSCFSIPEKEDR